MKVCKIFVGAVLFYSIAQGYEFRFYCDSLRIKPSGAKDSVIHVYTTNQFDEMTITWDNRPPLLTYLDDFTSKSLGWYTFSSPALDAYVNGCVNANQPIWFATRCRLWLWPGSIVWYYVNKEKNATYAAQLIPTPTGYSLRHDARVDEHHPNTNYGTDYLWNCDNDSDWRQISYFGFLPSAAIEEREKGSIIFKVYPNPVYNSASIFYGVLPKEAGEKIVLSVYDAGGKLIKNLVDESASPGEHSVLWKGENTNGERVPAGVYFFRLTIGDKSLTSKSLLVRL